MDLEYSVWRLPEGGPPRLTEREVQLWRIDIQQSLALVGALADMLSPDERERAGRYYAAKHSNQFVVCRAALRRILGWYLGQEATALSFHYGPQGKPFLRPPWDNQIRFNLSHSGNWALCAIALEKDIGVDIECIRPVDYEETGKNIFSPAEMDALRRLPAEFMARSFFTSWTRKESYVKAIGSGLSFPLRDVEFAHPADGQRNFAPVLVRGEPTLWQVHDLEVDDGYCAALAVEGAPLRLTLFEWQASRSGLDY
jgi:4'-phosphopantetheinyl transferase